MLPFRYHFDNIEDCFRSEAKFLNFMQKLTATHSLKAITIRHPKSNTVKHFLTVNDGTTCKHFAELDSGCGSVGRAVASNTRGLQFESSHRQICYTELYFCQLHRNDENEEKEAEDGTYKIFCWFDFVTQWVFTTKTTTTGLQQLI